MNKDELFKFIKSINIGDEFHDLEVDLNGTATLTFNSVFKTYTLISILQELARERKMQFKIRIFFISDGNIFSKRRCIKYTVIKPSKNFLNRKGYWKLINSKIAKYLLMEYKDKTEYYWNSLLNKVND